MNRFRIREHRARVRDQIVVGSIHHHLNLCLGLALNLRLSVDHLCPDYCVVDRRRSKAELSEQQTAWGADSVGSRQRGGQVVGQQQAVWQWYSDLHGLCTVFCSGLVWNDLHQCQSIESSSALSWQRPNTISQQSTLAIDGILESRPTGPLSAWAR